MSSSSFSDHYWQVRKEDLKLIQKAQEDMWAVAPVLGAKFGTLLEASRILSIELPGLLCNMSTELGEDRRVRVLSSTLSREFVEHFRVHALLHTTVTACTVRSFVTEYRAAHPEVRFVTEAESANVPTEVLVAKFPLATSLYEESIRKFADALSQTLRTKHWKLLLVRPFGEEYFLVIELPVMRRRHVCEVCHAVDLPAKPCAGCHISAYCGKAHQKADWLVHQAVCRRVGRKAHRIMRQVLLQSMPVQRVLSAASWGAAVAYMSHEEVLRRVAVWETATAELSALMKLPRVRSESS